MNITRKTESSRVWWHCNQHWIGERCHPMTRKSFRTPKKWSICLLNFNELPVRHIFQHIDDQTAGPTNTFLLKFSNALGHCPGNFANGDPDSLSNTSYPTAFKRVLSLYPIRSIKKLKINSWLPVKIIHAIRKRKYLMKDQNLSLKQSKHHAIYSTNYFKSSDRTEPILFAPRDCSVCYDWRWKRTYSGARLQKELNAGQTRSQNRLLEISYQRR